MFLDEMYYFGRKNFGSLHILLFQNILSIFFMFRKKTFNWRGGRPFPLADVSAKMQFVSRYSRIYSRKKTDENWLEYIGIFELFLYEYERILFANIWYSWKHYLSPWVNKFNNYGIIWNFLIVNVQSNMKDI